MVRRLWIAVGVLIVSVTVGVVLIGQIRGIEAGFEQLRQTGDRTEAKVVDRHAFGKLHWWTVEYEYASAVHRGDVHCAESCFEEGHWIAVYVDPGDPTRFLTERGKGSESWADIAIGIVTALAIAALFAIIYIVRWFIARRSGGEPPRFLRARRAHRAHS